MIKLFIVLISVLIFQVTSAQETFRIIAFYNLENLHDTIFNTDPNLILQDEFTPQSPKKYNTEKYYKKLDNLARVISEIGAEVDKLGPAIIGVAEVENRTVLEDLINRPALKNRNYGIIHYESYDERGIDVAFLYRKDCFVPIYSFHKKQPKFRTRDLVYLEGELDGEHIYLLVDHWSSRRGGRKRSEPRRISMAQKDRTVIDSIFSVNPDAKVIFMGDLNDNPNNISIVKYLKAKGSVEKLEIGDLYNPFYEKFKQGNGTLAHNDSWNLFDQIIISQSFLNDTIGYNFKGAFIFKKKYMYQQTGRFEGYPLRTYVGDEFQNGYSDHFPVYILISKKTK